MAIAISYIIEGYIESIASGLVVGLNMYRYLKGESEILFDKHTIIGALCKYISSNYI